MNSQFAGLTREACVALLASYPLELIYSGAVDCVASLSATVGSAKPAAVAFGFDGW